MPTRPGTIHRGSAKHRILAELERYPYTWVRWYQIPGLDDITHDTIRQAFQRLIRSGRVESRRVRDEPSTGSSWSQRGGHQVWHTEIRWRDDEAAT